MTASEWVAVITYPCGVRVTLEGNPKARTRAAAPPVPTVEAPIAFAKPKRDARAEAKKRQTNLW